MKKYIIEYDIYDDILVLLGHTVPHSNLANVKTIIVDLTEEEYEALVGADINIVENTPCKELLYAPAIFAQISPTLPQAINTYFNIENVHAAGFTGTGVNVAILDTGCRPNYADAMPGIIQQDYTGLGLGDPTQHGSVGSLTVSQTKDINNVAVTTNNGIAYGCTMYNMRVFEGGAAAVITAISYCIANNIHIINISLDLGGGDVATSINAALTAGIIIVCASGNTLFANVANPANIVGVIAVSGIQSTVGIPSFGSYITTDGHVQVTITGYNGGVYQRSVGGTSEAAFITSGLLAIYKQKYPTLNTAKAIYLLQRKALPLDTYTYTVHCSTRDILLNYQTGAGFLAPIY